MSQHGNNSVAGVIRNWFIHFLAIQISILLYLSDLYEKGLQYGTINSHRSAISMTHLSIDNVRVGAHPLVSRLMKGIFNLRPAVPKYLKTWDVSVVLKYLISLSPAPFLSLKK